MSSHGRPTQWLMRGARESTQRAELGLAGPYCTARRGAQMYETCRLCGPPSAVILGRHMPATMPFVRLRQRRDSD